jgi:hypothetical protein
MNEYDNDQMATPTDAVHEYVSYVGSTRPEAAWILSQYDTWEPNPYYSGPAEPHPEDDRDELREMLVDDIMRDIQEQADLPPVGFDDVPF